MATTPTTVQQPKYNEQDVTQYGGTNNAYNELIYAKKQYDTGSLNQNQGQKKWASEYATGFYNQLDQNEAGLIKNMNTQQLIDYVNSKQQPNVVTQQGGINPGNGTNQAGFLNSLQQATNASYEQQRLALEQAKSAQIANIEKAYNEAVESGKMTMQEARDATAKQIEGINADYYNQNERIKVNAEQRGIGNSQQFSGMQASTDAVRNTNVASANNTLNSTLSQLQQRLNTLGLNKAIEVNNANQQYDLQSAQAKAQADSDYYNSMFQIGLSDYESSRDHNYSIDLMNKQLQNDMKMANHNQTLTMETMEKQLGIDLKKMDYGSQLALVEMAKAHGYDMEKLKSSQDFEALMQKNQFSFQAGQNALDRSHSANQNALNRQAQAQSQQDSYYLELQRALAQYQPGTLEYQLAQKMQGSEDSKEYQKLANDYMADSIYAYAQENPGKFNVQGYNSTQDAYQAMLNQITGAKAFTPSPTINAPSNFVNDILKPYQQGIKSLK